MFTNLMSQNVIPSGPDAVAGPPGQEHPIRLIVLDGHGLFRASLARFLSLEPGLEVLGACGNSREALEIVLAHPVDLVLLDLDLGEERGIDFLSKAREAGYQGQFLIVASATDARDSALALKLGASGIFLKSDPPERLVQAIHRVAEGEVWIDRRVLCLLADRVAGQSEPVADRRFTGTLDGREQKVMMGILGGLSNRKIGENMGLSESSIKAIVQKLFARTGVKNRSQLVRVALEGYLGAPGLSRLHD